MKQNEDIRELLRKYNISCNEILEFLPNFSHVNRIYEELAKPLTEERKKVYLLAIKKVKERKKKLYED